MQKWIWIYKKPRSKFRRIISWSSRKEKWRLIINEWFIIKKIIKNYLIKNISIIFKLILIIKKATEMIELGDNI